MRSDISERAVGRWYGILSALGVGADFLKNKHGPCPACGGKDRYRWDNKDGRGTFYCSNCGSGDGFALLMNVKGMDFKQAVEQIESVIGTAKLESVRQFESRDEQRAEMKKRWKACNPVEKNDAVTKYLLSRGIEIIPKMIRAAGDRPAMVALMQAPDGQAAMVHTTLLTGDGRKAEVERPRLMMPGTIASGAAVRLGEFSNELGIAEGIETALSCTALLGVPCWAALNEVLLQKWVPPAGLRRVVVFGDNDANFVGQSAAYLLARRLSLARDRPEIVEVKIPEITGQDWNDVLLRGLDSRNLATPAS